MKVVILAGGLGSRISEESHLKPKPMIEIGNKPILWHIMKTYSYYGFNDFIICLGYKGNVIKEFFNNYYINMSDVTFDFRNGGTPVIHENIAEPWKVTLVDTGLYTQTAGRLSRIKKYIGNESFMLTYGDGICDIDLNKLLEFHKQNKKIATITAVQPKGRFGILDINETTDEILRFDEKSNEENSWINGGFMVIEPEIFNYINDNSEALEIEPMKSLALDHKLAAFKHTGFWQCMDTQRDKCVIEKMIEENNTPWIKW